LTLNLTPDGSKITGSATITTSTGNELDLPAVGTYTSKTGTSKITLKGAGGSLGLVISTTSDGMNVESAKGKLFGQNLDFVAPVP